jgi:hypothetical protein
MQALGGRARGIIVGSIIALGWAAFGLAIFSSSVRYPLLVIALVLTIVFVKSGVAMQRRAFSMPQPTSSQAQASKRVWRWFRLNLLAEIILMNVAIYMLTGAGLRDYWLPAISAVVGLHFWPMAHFFRVPSYWWVGSAMMAGAAITAILIKRDASSAHFLVHMEALTNAFILWTGVGMGVASVRSGSN